MDVVAPAAGEPWPDGHEPRSKGERRLWASFRDQCADEDWVPSLSAVAIGAGMSRTALSSVDGPFGVLRKAIFDEADRRRAVNGVADGAATAGAPRRTYGIRQWQAVAQRADSRLADYMAMAVRADERSRRSRELLRRIFDDFKAGRWVRVDPDAVMLADLSAELGLPSKALDQLEHFDR
jgi:hypothetical protein